MSDRSGSVRLQRFYDVTPDVAFDAWTNVESLGAWYAPVPGWTVTVAVLDARPGGRYRVSFGPAPAGDRFLEQGAYLIVDPPHRLRFRGEVTSAADDHHPADGTPDRTLVDVTFEPTATGTTVTVVETEHRDAASASDHEAGWSQLLENLATVLSNGGR